MLGPGPDAATVNESVAERILQHSSKAAIVASSCKHARVFLQTSSDLI